MIFSKYRTAALVLFAVATALRLLLWWTNPPQNAFDEHFEPILMIMQTGEVPAKDACWQCYHPPVFYWTSAMVGKAAAEAGMPMPQILKLIQFLSCLYGALTLAVLYLILRKSPLSDTAKLLVFGTICMLPRHIYMSAINANDSLSYLLAALSVLGLLVAFEKRLSLQVVVPLTAVMTITLFTKYTAFILVPAFIVALSAAYRMQLVPKKQLVQSVFLLVGIPLAVLAFSMASNFRAYGDLLPWNVNRLDPSLTQPRDPEEIDFWTFKPWESLQSPILEPGRMHSFWTLVYSGMWFDNEPKFIYFLDEDQTWWDHYYAWLMGKAPYPGRNPSLSRSGRLIGSGLVLFGLVPLALMLSGLYQYLRGGSSHFGAANAAYLTAMPLFPTLLLMNASGIIALTLRLPVYTAMKAGYFLISLPAFAVFLGLGIMLIEKKGAWMTGISAAFGILWVLAAAHIIQIALAMLMFR
jgi:hypothetical protein